MNQDRNSIGNWLQEKVIKEKFNNWFGFAILLLLGLSIAYFISGQGKEVSLIALMGIIAIPVITISLISLRVGFYILFILTSFLPIIERIFYLNVKSGTIIDIYIYVLMFAVLMRKAVKTHEWSFMKEPITIVLLIIFGYDLLQVFNINGNFTAWFFGARLSFRTICIYLIAEGIFETRKDIFTFLKVWLGVAVLASFYCFYQEFVGLPKFDLDWASKTTERINLLFIGGKWRKWSFISDVATFGLFMSFAGMMAFTLALAKFVWYKRVMLFIAGILFWTAMLYSGTRTAYVIVPIGVAIYVLLNINKVKTLAFAVIAGVVFVSLYFAPIYNPTLTRLRSAFNPSQDASMNVRDMNRARIRPYIFSHPFGGGLLTTGDGGEEHYPGHPLAGFPPDSGFLQTLLETGWPGLMLEMFLFIVVLGTGVRNYYTIRDPILKGYYLAFIASFFALTVSLYSQMSMDGFPLLFIYLANYVFMYRLKKLDQAPEDSAETI
ncbi:O-antigen ligase family protein [Fulvivirga sedimenti]|uniref:O-antigen ligase family protein n=1 Tax=Fulvivirga sedimenti TaxID=2879465 RepID=A0A9X1HYB8_9BACT|nr:O-antigen ligase family protein [Fulvivirga sedimenti]MCA6078689.1 O-antigen ligase family protein [Fulvivirga sedimenti]